MEKQALKNIISEEEKNEYIAVLTEELPLLRMKAGISQDELSALIGVSRQTYGAIERKDRVMGWNTYLSLIFFLDNNESTHDEIRRSKAFPHKFVGNINPDKSSDETVSELSILYPDVFGKLDEQAINSIRTMIMIEYARCTNQSGEAVVRSFNGMNFMKSPQRNDKIENALRKIKGKINEKN